MHVDNFPKYLSIQTTSFCNGHCIFCPYDDIKDLFPKKIMEEVLFRKIIDECSHHKNIERIILYLNNEPLTDPYLVERINYTKEKVPWASVHILTNGSLLTDELTEKLINSKLDWIGFSLHGIRKETIEKTMGINYELTFKRVLNFIERAKEKKDIKDYIMVTFLRHKYLSLEEKEEAFKFWKDRGIERISYFDGPVSRAGNVEDLPQVRHKKIKGCTSIWANEMIHIVENGDVIMCCMDWRREVILGNLNKQSIYEVWNSKTYEDIRDKRDGREDSEDNFICKRCEAAVPEIETTKIALSNQKYLDILLVICPPWGVDTPPLGIASLSTYLRSKGFKTEIFDFNIHLYNKVPAQCKYLWEMGSANYWRKEEVFKSLLSLFKKEIDLYVEKILFSGAKVVGFSVLSNSQDLITGEIIKRIKDKRPEIKVILGGTSVSIDEQRSFFENNLSDLINGYVIGEGEETLEEILIAYRENRMVEGIPGFLTYKNGKRFYIPRPLKRDLDSFPLPTFEEFNLDAYLNRNKGLIMEWSRGCIGNCSFCVFKAISPLFRKHSPEYVVDGIRYYINKYGTEHLSLVDSAVNCDMNWLENICEILIKEKLDMKFSALAIPRKEMGFEFLTKMKRTGFIRLEYGVESGSNKVLKAMNKIYTSEDAELTIRATKMAGITTVIYLILGFPGEREEDVDETIEFLKRNAQYIDLVKSVNPLYLMAGSPIYRNYKDYNISLPIENPDFKWWIGQENTYEIRLERVNKVRKVLRELNITYSTEDNQFERNVDIEQKLPTPLNSWQGKRKDILLIMCPMWGVNMPPLGIAYLYSYLKHKGYFPSVLDINIDMFNSVSEKDKDLWKMQNYRLWNDKKLFEEKILNYFNNKIDFYVSEILAKDVKTIGFSVNAGNLLFSIELARRIKDRDKSKVIIFGGPHSKWFKTDINYLNKYRDVYRGLYPGLVDIFVIGEGEITLGKILDCLKKGEEITDIKGIILYKNDKYLQLGEEQFIEDLDNLPFPDFSWASLEKYTEKKLPLLMSRGCIRKCAFCNDTFVSAKYRYRKANNLFEEIKLRLEENKINCFEFFDLIVNGNLKELERLCDLIIQEKIHINLMGQGAIRKGMNQDLLYKMKKAGFNSITYGVESFSNKVLQLMNKPYTYDEIKRIIRCTKKAGIRVYINIVVGFPGEGEEEFSETVKRLKECRRYLDGISSLAPCLITLGSYLQRNLEKYKIIYSGIDGYFSWYSEDGNNYEMRKKRVKTILSVADKLFFSVGTVNLYDEFQDVENNKEEIKSLAIEQRTAEKKRVDILLVTFPPWGVENPPLGLGYLNSYMRHKGLNSIVYDFNIHFYNTVESSYKMLWHVENKNFWSNEKTFPLLCEIFKEQIDYAVEKILSIDTDLIGFSVVDPKERLTIEVIKRIKNIAPQKKIILGGPACSTEEQRDFFEENIPGYIDYFVVGEGEETLYEIVQREKGILKKDRLEGIAFKINGKWQYEPRPYIDLENIPFPRYEGFDLSQYNGGKSVLVEWSRGCIGRCAFCKNYRLEGIFRIRSPENIIKELEFLLSHYGVKEFTIRDNIMNGDIKHLNTVCEEIIKRKFRLRWSGQITPRKEMDYELFRKMFEAGCYRIQIGVESGADKVLRNMRKFYVSRIAQDNIRQAKRAGMEVEVFIMVGFPGEGEEEFKETYNFIRRNAAYIDTIKSINTLHLIAGTDVYENYPKYNLRTLPERNWHYLWETTDGNNYSKRKERAQRLLNLACDLGLKVMETNIKEGKEELFLDIHYKEPLSKQLERLKIEINRLQELPQRRTRRILKNHSLFKFILLGFIFIYILFYITYFWVFKKIRGKFLLGGE